MNIVRFLGDRYIYDDRNSGLYFDAYPLKRSAGDEQVFNERIGVANGYLQSLKSHWMCTLLLNDDQVSDMSEEWRLIFAPKTQLILFRPGAEVGSFEIRPWFDYFNDGFLWSSADKVFTKYDTNALAHRFRTVEKKEVDDYLAGIKPPVVVLPIPSVGIPPITTVLGIPKVWNISVLGMNIAKITADEE